MCILALVIITTTKISLQRPHITVADIQPELITFAMQPQISTEPATATIKGT
jgi:hypothetical protein